MKIRNDHRVAVLLSSATFWLCACQGELAVVENLDNGSDELVVDDETEQSVYNNPESSSPHPFSDGSLDRDCACASSPSLQALGCQLGAAAVWDVDMPMTSDGGVVAFTVCEEDDSVVCNVVRWTKAGGLEVLAAGMPAGMSAAGDRVLVTGYSAGRGAALTLIDENGDRTATGLGIHNGSEGVLSASGEVITGNALVDGVVYLARWTAGVVEPIYPFKHGSDRMIVNPDATAIISPGGFVEGSASYRWTASDGFAFGLPEVSGTVWPEAQSSDGSVIAGRVPDGSVSLAFRWSEADGYEVLGSDSGIAPVYMSLDGSILAGTLGRWDPTTTSRAYRWTKASGIQELLPGVATQVVALSGDGSVAITQSVYEPDAPQVTYVWDEIDGTRTLEDELDARGVDRSGWSFGVPRRLSSDGKVLVGFGTCGNESAVYRIEL